MDITDIKRELQEIGDKERAQHSVRFFKCGKGEYGEGDVFIGATVPSQRAVAKKFVKIPIEEAFELLKSPIHEHRLTALFIIVDQYKKGDEQAKKHIYEKYLASIKKCVNNWDLVDSSAHKIVGEYVLRYPEKRASLYKLACSKSLWERRVAVISTFTLIRANQFVENLKIAEMLVNDDHDLMHKAVGWMLREVGNRDLDAEKKFLNKYYKQMPRTMLRYAIEKFEANDKAFYMKK